MCNILSQLFLLYQIIPRRKTSASAMILVTKVQFLEHVATKLKHFLHVTMVKLEWIQSSQPYNLLF